MHTTKENLEYMGYEVIDIITDIRYNTYFLVTEKGRYKLLKKANNDFFHQLASGKSKCYNVVNEILKGELCDI